MILKFITWCLENYKANPDLYNFIGLVLTAIGTLLGTASWIGFDVRSITAFFKKKVSDSDLIPEKVIPDQYAGQLYWVGAPQVRYFFGRLEVLRRLKRWVLVDNKRIILIKAIGGVGKSALVVKFVKGDDGSEASDLSIALKKGIVSEFDQTIWWDFRSAIPPLLAIQNILEIIFSEPSFSPPVNIDKAEEIFMAAIRKKKILIIFDNLEAISSSEKYLLEYEFFGRLFCRIRDENHKSCLIITSRVRPPNLFQQDQASRIPETGNVVELELMGLDSSDAIKIFESCGRFEASTSDWDEIVRLYNGNPLCLRLAASHILLVHNGILNSFLKNGHPVFGTISGLIHWHFKKLTNLQKWAIYWVALYSSPVTSEMLIDDFPPIPNNNVSQLLGALNRIQMLEVTKSVNEEILFFLQPMIAEFLTDRIINLFSIFVSSCNTRWLARLALFSANHYGEQIEKIEYRLFESHSLIRANAPEHVKALLRRVIVTPIAERFSQKFKDNSISRKLIQDMLITYCRLFPKRDGYFAANLIAIAQSICGNLDDFDFSGLIIKNVDFGDFSAKNVNFDGSNFINCRFLRRHGGQLSIALAGDADLMVSAGQDDKIRAWKMSDGCSLGVIGQHVSWVLTVAISANGQLLASGGIDGNLVLWNLSEKTKIWQKHFNSWILCTAISPNGILIASGTDGGIFTINEVSAGIIVYQEVFFSRVTAIQFSKDGAFLVVAMGNNSIRSFDINGKSWNWVTNLEDNAGAAGRCVIAYNNENSIIGVGGANTILYLIRASDGVLLAAGSGLGRKIRGIVFSSDDTHLFTGGEETVLNAWDIRDLKTPIARIREHSGAIRALAFSNRYNVLITASLDCTIRWWLSPELECTRVLRGHMSAVWCIFPFLNLNGNVEAFSVDGRGNVCLWGMDRENPISVWSKLSSKRLWSVATDGKGTLVFGGDECEVVLLRTNNSQILQPIVLGYHAGWIRATAISNDGQVVVTGAEDHLCKAWDTNTGQLIGMNSKHTGRILNICFIHNDRSILSTGEDGLILLWEAPFGENLITQLNSPNEIIRAISVNNNQSRLGVVSLKGRIIVWDISTVTPFSLSNEREFSLSDERCWHGAMAPDGSFFAVALAGGDIAFIDIEKETIISRFNAHQGHVWWLMFEKSTGQLWSCGEDEVVAVWDTRQSLLVKKFFLPRPYEGMNISNTLGIAQETLADLVELGAIRRVA